MLKPVLDLLSHEVRVENQHLPMMPSYDVPSSQPYSHEYPADGNPSTLIGDIFAHKNHICEIYERKSLWRKVLLYATAPDY